LLLMVAMMLSLGITAGADGSDLAPVSMSIAFWDMVDLGSDAWGQRILDKFNLDVTAISLSWDNWPEQLQVMAAGDDLPNFFADYDVHFDWIDQGLTRDYPEELFSKYPIINDSMLNQPYAQAVKEMAGGYYTLIRPFSTSGLYDVSQNGVFYRKDWMAEAGITKEPETIDEFYELLKAFKELHPSAYPWTSNNLDNTMFAAFGSYVRYWMQNDEGVWEPGYMSKKNIDALKFLRKVYQEGLLDPEFLRNSYNEAISKLAQGSVGAMIRNSDSLWFYRTLTAFEEANPGLNPLDYLTVMGPLRNDPDAKPLWMPNIESGGTMVSVKTTDEQIDRMLMMVEYFMSEEGLMYRRFGEEGVDYKMEGDQIVSMLAPIEGVASNYLLVTTYPTQVFGWFADWDGDNDAVIPGNPGIPDDFKIEHMRFREKFMAAMPDLNLTPYLIPTPAKNRLAIDWEAEFVQIIMGEDDVEVMFDEFLNQIQYLGVPEAIEELNARVAELGIK